MKTAAAREARQLARVLGGLAPVGTPGLRFEIPHFPVPLIGVTRAPSKLPRDATRSYDRLSHRERGRARARWRTQTARLREQAGLPSVVVRRNRRTWRGAIRAVACSGGLVYFPTVESIRAAFETDSAQYRAALAAFEGA